MTGAGERGRADWSGYDGHRPLAVFDIDGVLADVRHRLHHLQSRPQRWNAFFLAADRDPLLEEGAARLRAAQAEHDVVYLTGRPERNRALTRTWLAGARPAHRPAAHAPGRRLPAGALGQAQHAAPAGPHPDVASVLDDDPAVVAVLCADGWPVELATWLPHSSTLQSAQEQQGRT